MSHVVFMVEGSIEFPNDMLRYDECWPASSTDAQKISSDGKRTVQLVTAKSTPAIGRWQSFGWDVIRIFN